jgi:hypothetical protein
VSSQRTAREAKKLDADRSRRLDELGFVWDLADAWWEEMFTALVDYGERFGDCNVPQIWAENPALGNWLGKQRKARKAGKLGNDCIRRLDELGFIWDMLDAAWEEMFVTLVDYRDRFGDCKVPKRWPENRRLGSWATNQRISKKSGKLSEDRIRRLEELGFVWNTRDTAWEERFAALVNYRDRSGNCNVPQNWPENPQLAEWVSTQRGARKANKLDADRIRSLDELGFEWGYPSKRG